MSPNRQAQTLPELGVDLSVNDRRDALAEADAHGREAVALVLLFEDVEQRGHQASTGRAQGVSECDGAAVDVDLIHVHAERASAAQCDGGEGFIELNYIEIIYC